MDAFFWKKRHCRQARRALAHTLVGVIASAATIIALMPASASGQRWYGNTQLTISDTRSETGTIPKSGRLYANTFLNVEDVLFYKNRIRLAGKFDWRDELHSSYSEYRPTYYFDLNGYGYSVNTSYSPYKRKGALLGGTSGVSPIDVYYRNWRGAVGVAVPKFPTLSLAYNRLRFFDRETTRRYYDVNQQNFVAETGYSRERYSVGANYTRIRRDDRINAQATDLIQAISGTFSATTPSWRYGNASASYNIYMTERDALVTVDSRGRTHSVSGIATGSVWRPLSASLSYSGRFTRSTQLAETADSRSETGSAGLSFSPVSYFEASLVKAYQIEKSGTTDILEYVAMTGSLSRSLRQGVDTRLSVSRTIYQQSNRIVERRDTLTDTTLVERLDHYAVDTYYGSAGFSPAPYVTATANISLTRDAKSPQPDRRYQINSSVDGRFFLRANLEGRASYSSGFLGSKLRLGHAYLETVNAGISWMPRSNLNLSATYIFSSYSTGTRNRSESIGLYLNYAFRRVFTFYVSYNEQQLKQIPMLAAAEPGPVTVSQPRTKNVQLLIYTSRRSTLSLGYLENRTGLLADGNNGVTRTWNGTINFQI